MLPKTIHYCWFGGKPLPAPALRYIESWKRFLPDHEIIEWNENNFDVNIIPYTREAYKLGKYAFVSDYARYWVLYKHGGIYFDTDVEVIRPFDDIIEKGPFLGIEKDRKFINIGPGLGMGAMPGMDFYKEVIDFYTKWEPAIDGEVPPLVVRKTTALMRKKGWVEEDRLQTVEGITIYPNEYFNPYDDYTGETSITPSTHSIHYYAKTWVQHYGPLRNKLAKFYHRLLKIIRLHS